MKKYKCLIALAASIISLALAQAALGVPIPVKVENKSQESITVAPYGSGASSGNTAGSPMGGQEAQDINKGGSHTFTIDVSDSGGEPSIGLHFDKIGGKEVLQKILQFTFGLRGINKQAITFRIADIQVKNSSTFYDVSATQSASGEGKDRKYTITINSLTKREL